MVLTTDVVYLRGLYLGMVGICEDVSVIIDFEENASLLDFWVKMKGSSIHTMETKLG